MPTGRFPYKLAATKTNFAYFWTLEGTNETYTMLPKKRGLSNRERISAIRDLLDAWSRLASGYSWWLDSGSLLGVHRAGLCVRRPHPPAKMKEYYCLSSNPRG